MRSSKSRSRSKSNRPRPLGNIVNRVFDSSGPEGKVRGTPQQIIDKYLQLARDAQLGNDRVAAENFLQHAEHYTRMLAEAQREVAREAEQRRDRPEPQGQGQNQTGRSPRGDDDAVGSGRRAPADTSVAVIDFEDRDLGLVETPETSAQQPPPEAAGGDAPTGARPADAPDGRTSGRQAGGAEAETRAAADAPVKAPARAPGRAAAEASEGPARADSPAAPKPVRRRAVRKPKAPASETVPAASDGSSTSD